MNARMINHFISLLAIVALWRWWTPGGALWWILLFLLFANWFNGAVAEKSVEIEAKEFVVRFWRRIQLFTNVVCFVVSMAVIVQSFQATP